MTAQVYIDTNAFVYAVEGVSATASAVGSVLQTLSRKGSKPVTSEITLAEILSYQGLTADLRGSYQDLLIESQTITLQPVTRDILLFSADLRRSGTKLKLPDAIHLATAIQTSCRFILTNDHRFRSDAHGLTIVRTIGGDVEHLLSALDD